MPEFAQIFLSECQCGSLPYLLDLYGYLNILIITCDFGNKKKCSGLNKLQGIIRI